MFDVLPGARAVLDLLGFTNKAIHFLVITKITNRLMKGSDQENEDSVKESEVADSVSEGLMEISAFDVD